MPRAGLSTDVVVTEAARVVDEVGPGSLTLAVLAQRFGVAQPSLYKHVGGLDDLHDRLGLLALHELAAALRKAAAGQARTDALRAVAAAYRSYAHRHPGRYRYVLRARPGDEAHGLAGAEVLEVLDAVLAGYRITDEDARVDAARLLRSALHGFVSLEIEGGFAMPRSVDRSFERLVDSLDTALSGWLPG